MKNKQKIIAGVAFAILAVGVGIYFLNTNKQNDVKGANTVDVEVSNLQKALGKDELVVGIDEAFPPVTFKDINGQMSGMDIDFAKEVEKRTGVKMVFKPVEWDNIIPSLLAKDIDIIWSGMSITPEREAKVDFVKYSQGPKGVAFVLNDSSIKTVADLQGKVIGAQSGSYQETDLKAGTIVPVGSWKDIRSFSTLPEALIDLGIGRVDAIICSPESAGYYIEKTLQQSTKFRVVEVGYGVGFGGVAFRKGSLELKSALQEVVDQIIADGTASKITMSWLGIDKYSNWKKGE
jgi:polar amino acid transport system substrate-binding protein